MEYPDFKVLVRCFTYNHSKYICETLDGFCRQRTSFPFICCIIDDASTDGEQDVIRQYIENHFIINIEKTQETDDYYYSFAQHKNNENCFFAVYYLKYNHNSNKRRKISYLSDFRNICKYEAACEGDDYWISDLKLQKQVEILEDNEDYAFCVHAFYKLVNGCLETVDKFQEQSFVFGKQELLHHWLTQPLTSLYRIDSLPSEEEVKKYRNYMDNHFYYLLLLRGKGYNIGEYMGVYRISGEGVWTSQNRLGRYKSDLISYRELYENYKDDYLMRKLISVYSTYIYLSIKNHTSFELLPFSLLGMKGYTISFLKLMKKLFFGMSY